MIPHNKKKKNDTTEEKILTLLGLDGDTYLRENSLARRQHIDCGRIVGCIPVRMPQKFIETYGGLKDVSPFGLSKMGSGKDMDILREGIRLSHVKK